MPLNNQRLAAKLAQYLERFASEWTYERLIQLGDAIHNEYEHDDDPNHPDFIQVHLQVLEHGNKNEREYIFASVDISDNRRGFGKGSAYRPMSGEMWVFADGNTDVYAKQRVASETFQETHPK